MTNLITNFASLIYITNILASQPMSDGLHEVRLNANYTITTTTNVLSWDNSSGCNLCYNEDGSWKGFTPATFPASNCQPYHRATERWIATNIVQHFKIETGLMQFPGFSGAMVKEWDYVVSGVTNREVLEQRWTLTNTPTSIYFKP